MELSSRLCKRCLTEKLSAEAYAAVKEYIALIPEEKRTDSAAYRERLDKCLGCDELINGMCAKCGCFVEIRAAYAFRQCPHETPRW